MKTAVSVGAGILIGFIGGYYVGYDHGFKVSLGGPIDGQSLAELTGAMEAIIGTWQSQDDAKFIREFRPDGMVVDLYDSVSTASTTYWMLFTKDIPDPSYTGPLEDGARYLSIAQPGEDPLYFEIVRLDQGALELVYLNRGGVLTFTRISP